MIPSPYKPSPCAMKDCYKTGEIQFAKNAEWGLKYYYACPEHEACVGKLLKPLGYVKTSK